MKLFKKLTIIFCLLILTGCSSNTSSTGENEVFSLSSGQKKEYFESIEELLNSFYWYYDSSSVLFFDEELPSDDSEKTSEIFESSKKCGFDLEKYKGKNVISATANLNYFNGDEAGICHIIFNKNTLIGAYYTDINDSDRVFSLDERNIFVSGNNFENTETEAEIGFFDEVNTYFNENSFVSCSYDSEGNGIIASIKNNAVNIYKFEDRLYLYKTLYVSSGGNCPISASFISSEDGAVKYLAVIEGQRQAASNTDGEAERLLSERVLIYDSDFNLLGYDVSLESTDYSCVADLDGKIAVFKNSWAEIYEISGEKIEKVNYYSLNHSVTGLLECDLDNNGEKEYLMTDGMDFYIYQKNGHAFELLWRTHLGISSFESNIYAGDLNRDGIKEIYICDAFGTSIKYVIKDYGIAPQNDNIEYGNRYLVFDFNLDGLDDYIFVDSINEEVSLYLGK